MALPTKEDLQKLDYVYWGAPFCQVEAKELNTQTLDYVYYGAPFYAALGEYVAPPTYNITQFMVMF